MAVSSVIMFCVLEEDPTVVRKYHDSDILELNHGFTGTYMNDLEPGAIHFNFEAPPMYLLLYSHLFYSKRN
jgi:hypothetical protein